MEKVVDALEESGFDGIAQMARRMVYSFQTEQDTRQLIQQKGLGCTCCL